MNTRKIEHFKSFPVIIVNCNNFEICLLNGTAKYLISIIYAGIRSPTKSLSGADLPLSRLVSYTLHPNLDIDDKKWTLSAMQYGQIITHDMAMVDGPTQSSKL